MTMRGAVTLMKNPSLLVVALLMPACGPTVSGEIRDAASEQPVARARVDLIDVGWGQRGGHLVWDAEQRATSMSDERGRFVFSQASGGSLRVVTAGSVRAEARICSTSPTIVRVGGPYPELRADRRLLFTPMGTSSRSANRPQPMNGSADDLGLRGSGSAFNDGATLRIEAAGGVRFVAGTGAIPRAPPPPYERVIELDLNSDCGWLFVRLGEKAVAVIEVATLSWEQDPGQPKLYVLLYTPLPD